LLRPDSLPKREKGESLVEAKVEAAKTRKEKANRPDMGARSKRTDRGGGVK
jgi:hypothetical protein